MSCALFLLAPSLTKIKTRSSNLDLNQQPDLDRTPTCSAKLKKHPMADPANPFEAVQAIMLENLEKVQSATQSYIDTVEKAMRSFPGANQDQITDFKAYLDRKAAANRDFVEKLLRAKDLQEAIRIEVEYFRSQLKAAAEDARQIRNKLASAFNRSTD
jgi:hypothetical protein